MTHACSMDVNPAIKRRDAIICYQRRRDPLSHASTSRFIVNFVFPPRGSNDLHAERGVGRNVGGQTFDIPLEKAKSGGC